MQRYVAFMVLNYEQGSYLLKLANLDICSDLFWSGKSLEFDLKMGRTWTFEQKSKQIVFQNVKK